MTDITAKIVLDSVSPDGVRLTTMHLRYPRFIHSELMTHRVFSRNARSSRAVPVATMLQEIIDNPVIPLHWGKNQKGMQASETSDALVQLYPTMSGVPNEVAWLMARDHAVHIARAFAGAGYHKQVVNRLLEPFMHIDVLVTATDWDNFLWLRDHKDAEPHIQLLAKEVKKALDGSKPLIIPYGGWHMPYVKSEDYVDAEAWLKKGRITRDEPSFKEVVEVLKKLSAARCARISYKPFDGNGSIEAEIERYDSLITSQPMHASPVEHQATPDEKSLYRTQVATFTLDGRIMGWTQIRESMEWDFPGLHGNLTGWIQFRKKLPGERYLPALHNV